MFRVSLLEAQCRELVCFGVTCRTTTSSGGTLLHVSILGLRLLFVCDCGGFNLVGHNVRFCFEDGREKKKLSFTL